MAAYLNGELLTTLTTDYDNLTLPNLWELGAAKPLGILAQCSITIDAISVTTATDNDSSASAAESPAPTPAAPTPASAYKLLASSITNSYSTQSSAAATQPAPRVTPVTDDLRAVVATSQPVISDLAAGIASAAGAPPAHGQ